MGVTKKTTCKHFTGLWKQTECRAGVKYDQFRTPELKRGEGSLSFAFPCLHKEVTCCAKREYKTPEEEKREEEEIARHIQATMKARRAIVEHAGGKRGVTGKINCTACPDGSLHYSIAACNGHIHASCTTSGCLRWME